MKKRRAQIRKTKTANAIPAADKENSGIGIFSGIKQSLLNDSLVVSKQNVKETIAGSPKNVSWNFSFVEASPIIGKSRVAHGVKGNFHSNGRAQASLCERKNFQNVLHPRKLPLPKPIPTRSSPRLGVQSSAPKEVDQEPCLNKTSLLSNRQCRGITDKSSSDVESFKSSSEDSSANVTVVHAERKRLSKDSGISSQETLIHEKVLPEDKGISGKPVEPNFTITRRIGTRNRKQAEVVKEASIKRPQKKRGDKSNSSKQEDYSQTCNNNESIKEPQNVTNHSKLRKLGTVEAEKTEEIKNGKTRGSSMLAGQRKSNQRNKGNTAKTCNLKQTITKNVKEKVDIPTRQQSQPGSSKTARKRKLANSDITKEIAVKKPKMHRPAKAKSHNSSSKVFATPKLESKKALPSVDQREGVLVSAKPKLPIWHTTTKQTPVARERKSKRLSALAADDIFAFKFTPEEEGTRKLKKARKRKPATRKPCTKPKMKSTYMVTDPSWQQEIKPSTGVSLVTAKPKSKRQDDNILSVDGNVLSVDDNTSSVDDNISSVDDNISSVDDNYMSDHDVPDYGDADEVMQELEFETCSAFVNTVSSTDSGPLFRIPTSISACPTPALPRNLSKFAGSTSTPRVEESVSALSKKGHNLESRLDKPVEEEIKECFGFDDDSEDEVDDLDISPVHRSHTRSNFEISGYSDKFENSVGLQPTRFSWGSLRPGQRSYSSMTRSLSMVNHGFSSVSAISASHMSDIALRGKNSESGISLSRASGLLNQVRSNDSAGSIKHLPGNINTQRRRNTAKGEGKIQKNTAVAESVNVSILFDEEPVEVGEETDGAKDVQSEEKNSEKNPGHVDKVATVISPQKSFIKAPRRSYDREALDLSRKKFLEQHGVSSSRLLMENRKGKTKATSQKTKQTKLSSQKPKKKKLTKKKQKSNEDPKDDSSQSILSEKEKPKRKKKAKENEAHVFEKSFQDWCSDLNSHFSEIEDLELVVQ